MLKERDIRKAAVYENEVPSLFDFVMLYMKLFKMGCQLKISDKKQWYWSTYHLLCEVEQVAYDFVKSVLIDAESLKYKPSILVAAVISVSLEILFKTKLQEKQASCRSPPKTDMRDLPVLAHMK